MIFFEILKTLIFGYPVPPEFLNSSYPEWIQRIGGLHLSVWITIVSLILAFPIAFFLAQLKGWTPAKNANIFSKISIKIANFFGYSFVEILRGIPVMILVLVIFFLPYQLLEIRIPAILLAIFAMTLYASAYLSEVFRSGERAVKRELTDSALTLGLSKFQILIHIKFPIIWAVMLPGLASIAITIFKDTSVLTVVGVAEMTFTSRQIIVSSPVSHAIILGTVIILYFVVGSLGALMVSVLEKSINQRMLV
jgi:glutamine transport system substrate-binding protein/glutamine transport system permease protein